MEKERTAHLNLLIKRNESGFSAKRKIKKISLYWPTRNDEWYLDDEIVQDLINEEINDSDAEVFTLVVTGSDSWERDNLIGTRTFSKKKMIEFLNSGILNILDNLNRVI